MISVLSIVIPSHTQKQISFSLFFTSMDIILRKWQESAGKLENQTEPKQTQENTDDMEETHAG